MVQEAFPILSVADLTRSLALYRDLLGGVVDYAFPPDGEPQFVTLRLGTAVAALQAAGHPIREAPSDQPWGERIARAADPDGYELLLVARR